MNRIQNGKSCSSYNPTNLGSDKGSFGASVIDIFGLLTGDFMKLVFIAIIIATLVSWYLMQKWLQDFAYRISSDWWYFLGAGALTMSIALITAGYQAVNAARVNPVENLRTE